MEGDWFSEERGTELGFHPGTLNVQTSFMGERKKLPSKLTYTIRWGFSFLEVKLHSM